MMALLGLLATLAGTGSVTALSVQPAGDRTEVVVDVQGVGQVTDFTLGDPHRIVLDITGARNGLAAGSFEVRRGGIRVVRSSQFRPDVVRVVLEMGRATDYVLERDGNRIRVSFPNHSGTFEPWRSNGDGSPARPPTGDSGVQPERTVDTAETRPAARDSRRDADRMVEAADSQPAVDPVRENPQPRIHVFFKDTPIREVLATFSEFSGRSIVAGSTVSGEITADIRNQPWDMALHEILLSHGLAARETETGIIRVETMQAIRQREKDETEREDWADLVTQQFRIRYASVDSIRPAVEGLVGDRGQVSTNRSTNTLLITGRRSAVDRIAPLIQELDVRTPQVSISARIIFIDRTALDEYGITYDLKDMRTNGSRINTFVRPIGDPQDADMVVRLGGSSIAALADANRPLAKSALQVVTSLVLGRHTLIGFLEALREVSMSEVQAEPLIRTMSHREAYVLVGERTPVRVIDMGSPAQQQGQQPRATVDFQETGIILRTTPHVTGNQILLELHAENSRPALAPSDLGFTFQTQESKTQILLQDGETAVISGLTIVERERVHSGIPLLMDIPIAGAFFRGTRDRESKKDLLIMVTPHIVRDSD